MARCKTCKCNIEKWKEVRWNLYTYCTPKHRQEHQRELARKQKEKDLKEREVEKKREEKKTSIAVLTKTADKLWSELIKIQWGNKCWYCWKWSWEVQLHSHHLFTRSRKATRWDLENGICLCAWHHTLSSEMSAHQTSLEFFLWLEELKGREFIEKISKRSQEVYKVTSEDLQAKIELFKILKMWNDKQNNSI